MWAIAVAFGALTTGFAIGAIAIGPKFVDDALAEAAAAQRAERFSPRTVDLARDYPEPFAYRTPTPAFPHQGPKGNAAVARSSALETYASARRHEDLDDRQTPAFPAGPFEDNPDTGAHRDQFDRHTGVAY
ncbi:MAG: hypothetical protein FJX62_13915 [Alphaproteobacteria bacterium]|nr:hypothetical protein [Alphaproteobacteria bacterium]